MKHPYEAPLYIQPNATGFVYRYYIHGGITDVENYADLLDILVMATEQDQVRIYINSHGGLLTTALNIMEKMMECKGTVVAEVSGDCQSAATLIMLGADSYVISEYTSFLFHDFSAGVVGKGGEMYDHVFHMKTTYSNMFRRVYSSILDGPEIEEMLKGVDHWMTGADVIERLNESVKNEEYVEDVEEEYMEPEKEYVEEESDLISELADMVTSLAESITEQNKRIEQLATIVCAEDEQKKKAPKAPRRKKSKE